MSRLEFTAQDRILMIAPHPDDESLAAGGLLQRAAAARAAVKVVFVTDGDNNPWPQRVVERKWRIRTDDRARWGMRRRCEAEEAIKQLGLPPDSAVFLGLPDQGMTRSLLCRDPDILSILSGPVEAFDPTIVLMPAASDLHPDHNALNILLRLVLDRREPRRAPRELCYVVHSRGRQPAQKRITLDLTAEEKSVKRQAILAHDSQMVLSRRRFVAYARDAETYYAPAAPAGHDSRHPIYSAGITAGALCLDVRLASLPGTGRGASVLVALESLSEGSIRWRIPLLARTGRTHIRDAGTWALLRMATIRVGKNRAQVRLPIASLLPLRLIFVKLERRHLFFDAAGWREIPVTATDSPAPEPPGAASSSSRRASGGPGDPAREPTFSEALLSRLARIVQI